MLTLSKFGGGSENTTVEGGSGMASYNIAKTAFSRVFLVEGRASPVNEPAYQSCLRSGGVDQSFGDIEKIECPSDLEYGQFIEIGSIQGAIERATSSLMGRYASDIASALLELARRRCPVDVHVHFGKCTNPKIFNTFTKALVWENVSLTNYSTEDLGALSSDENAAIMETSDISIGNFYEVLQLTFQERASTIVTNQLVDAIVCDLRTCGECGDFSDGCYKGFVLQGGILGSPGTAPDVIYTSNKGGTWGTDEITTMISSETADGISCLGDYVFVVSNDTGSLHYKEKDFVTGGTPALWAEITTGFVAGGEPNDVWSVGTGAFICGDGGYVYYTTDPSLGVSVLDAGEATTNNLNAIHALSDDRAVAVGQTDTIIYTTNRVSWVVATATGGGGNLQGVWMRTEDEWWVVDDNGDVWYTVNAGVSWTEKVIPGIAITALYDIQFATDSVGYIAGTANAVGALWRTYDGGYSWVKLPEGVSILPGGATQYNAIAACIHDPNYLIAAGADVTNDGVLLVGED